MSSKVTSTNPILLIATTFVGTIIVLGGAFCYAYLEWHTRAYAVTPVLLPLFYAALIALLARYAVSISGDKVISLLALLCGIWLGCLAEYFGWVFWFYEFKGQMLLAPRELWSAIMAESHEHPGGTYYVSWVFWVIEAIIVILAGIVGGGSADE